MTTFRPSSTTSSPDAAARPAARPGARRRGFVDGVAVTLRTTGLSLLRGRWRLALVAVACLVPLIAPGLELVQRGSGARGAFGFVDTITAWSFARVNLVVALFLGNAAIGEEIDGRTLPYLLTRPVPRSALLVGRWLAAVVTAFVLLATTFLLVYLATVAPMGSEALVVDLPALGHALFGLAISLFAYCACFLLLSVVTRWSLLFGLALIFGWEEFATSLPGRAARYTVQHHVYTVLARTTGDENYVRLTHPLDHPMLTTSQSLLALAWLTIVALALALWRFRRRAYLV
jgi:ABC-type transport system involved in multi-copper enzyme maturation permease subunit